MQELEQSWVTMFVFWDSLESEITNVLPDIQVKTRPINTSSRISVDTSWKAREVKIGWVDSKGSYHK